MIWMSSTDICLPLLLIHQFKGRASSILLMVWRQVQPVRHHPGPLLTDPQVPCACQTTTWHKTMTSPPRTTCLIIARRQAVILLILQTCIVHLTKAAPVIVNIRITKNPALPWNWSPWVGVNSNPLPNSITTACLLRHVMASTVTMATPTCLKGTIPTPPLPPVALSLINSWEWVAKCLTQSLLPFLQTNSGIDMLNT